MAADYPITVKTCGVPTCQVEIIDDTGLNGASSVKLKTNDANDLNELIVSAISYEPHLLNFPVDLSITL